MRQLKMPEKFKDCYLIINYTATKQLFQSFNGEMYWHLDES
jgi:hypothetical protein